jgi:hypothetical protein
MDAGNILLGLIIGFPLLGALYLLIFQPEIVPLQKRITSLVLIVAGISSLTRFFVTGQSRCTFTTGRESCLQVGILALSVILLNGLTLTITLTRDANRLNDFQFFSLINATWAVHL